MQVRCRFGRLRFHRPLIVANDFSQAHCKFRKDFSSIELGSDAFLARNYMAWLGCFLRLGRSFGVCLIVLVGRCLLSTPKRQGLGRCELSIVFVAATCCELSSTLGLLEGLRFVLCCLSLVVFAFPFLAPGLHCLVGVLTAWLLDWFDSIDLGGWVVVSFGRRYCQISGRSSLAPPDHLPPRSSMPPACKPPAEKVYRMDQDWRAFRFLSTSPRDLFLGLAGIEATLE